MPRLLLTSLTMPASPVWLAVLCPLPMCVRRARLLLWACLRSFVRLLRWPLRVRACVCVLACLRACVLACLRVCVCASCYAHAGETVHGTPAMACPTHCWLWTVTRAALRGPPLPTPPPRAFSCQQWTLPTGGCSVWFWTAPWARVHSGWLLWCVPAHVLHSSCDAQFPTDMHVCVHPSDHTQLSPPTSPPPLPTYPSHRTHSLESCCGCKRWGPLH
jgi:hypothetical protein